MACMSSSAIVRQQLHPVHLRLRPEARRRALLAGLVIGPFASAGCGLAWAGLRGLTDTPNATTWVFAALGVVSLAVALGAGARLLRPHHRATRVAVLATLLVGVPLAVLAPAIVLSVVLQLATASGAVAAPPSWLVFLAGWAAGAAPGLVLGPPATWWVSHRARHLPSELASDPAAVARFEATTVESGPGAAATA